jgi:branched-subunit amino acid transport protein
MNIWVLMVIGGLLTFGIRLSFILLFSHTSLPAWLQRSLRYVPPAVLSAIIFPEVFLHNGELDISLGNARLLAGLAAGLVAWRTRNALLTILSGMAVLFLLQWLY